MIGRIFIVNERVIKRISVAHDVVQLSSMAAMWVHIPHATVADGYSFIFFNS